MRKTLLAGCLLVATAFSASAQRKKTSEPVQQAGFDINQFKNWKPRNIGPSGMSGRITAIDAVIDNPSTIYIGAASGGVWKTDNGGAGWKPVFDEQPILNIGSIAIQQSNPNVVWVGTGEGNPRNSINIGEGMYKTLDAGKTWQKMGLEKTRNIHRVIIDPVNPNTVYAGAIGNPYAPNPDRGVFKTTDGGASWNKILFTNDSTGIGDMIMDPSNPNKLFAAMWHHYRTPWSFHSGGSGSGLYMTLDGGGKWKKLGKENGLPEGDYGRIGLAISRSNPDVVYALIEATKNGLYRSDDGGYNWKLINSNPQWVTNRPFYFQEIAVDPLNENRLWLIYQMIGVSEDGGKDFKVVIPYNGIHPDHHAFWIHPKDNKFIIDGNDGGIGISRDLGKTWIFDEKIPVGQFYHINVDNEIPYNVMGGMQDNGSWRGPAYTWINGGIRNYYWESIWGGDGFDMMPDPDDASWVYAMSQGGNVGRYNTKTGESWFVKPANPNLQTQLRFNWNAAIAQDPFDNNTIYFGSQYLHRSANKGNTWETISGDLSTNDSAKIDQNKNGGLSLDITGAENHCTILTIAPSAKEKGIIWVGTDDGNVQLTRDGGITWTNFSNKIPGLPKGAWIPQIQAGRHNAGEAFVVANDYRQGDFRPYIFRTTDFGKTWTKLLDEKKVMGYALCVLQDPVQPNLIFAGTEQGLWVSLNNGNTWQQWKNGYPSVSTYDLAIQEREADLVIATFGRALWVLDDIRPLRSLAAGNGLPVKKVLTVFEAPLAYQAEFRNAPGYEWSTWGLWDAENRRRGAAITYHVDKRMLDTTARKKADTVQVKIYDENNELIRNLKWKADSGYNRSYWGMERKGSRRPGSLKPTTNAPEQGGDDVLPGTYKVVIELAGQKDSTRVSVNADPRMGDRKEILLAQQNLKQRLQRSADKLIEGMDRLTEAEEITKKMDAQLKDITGKDADTLKKAGKKIQDDIKKLREFVNGKSIERQGYGRPQQPPTPMSVYQQANRYISAKALKPGADEERMVTEAEQEIGNAVEKINLFFNNDWKNYRKLAEDNPVKLFKDYSEIK
ncbi:hypothetical protein [Flavihumibacter sp. ZG627]|uniref:VPS10 domain-containing protein n=1 Tax=Flavihumibacter sp. ZG627 TaxID=1463156 RepID=UPI001C10809A|nr:hypothetical protein [Flavihumibacter sp. ZG627]